MIDEMNDKLDRLAILWGERYQVSGGVRVGKGMFSLKRKDRAWTFVFSVDTSSDPAPLTSMSLRIRLHCIAELDQLEDTLKLISRNRGREVMEACDKLDQMIEGCREA